MNYEDYVYEAGEMSRNERSTLQRLKRAADHGHGVGTIFASKLIRSACRELEGRGLAHQPIEGKSNWQVTEMGYDVCDGMPDSN